METSFLQFVKYQNILRYGHVFTNLISCNFFLNLVDHFVCKNKTFTVLIYYCNITYYKFLLCIIVILGTQQGSIKLWFNPVNMQYATTNFILVELVNKQKYA